MVSLFLFLSQLPVGFLCDPKMSPITVHVPCTGKTIIIIIIHVLAYILMALYACNSPLVSSITFSMADLGNINTFPSKIPVHC